MHPPLAQVSLMGYFPVGGKGPPLPQYGSRGGICSFEADKAKNLHASPKEGGGSTAVSTKGFRWPPGLSLYSWGGGGLTDYDSRSEYRAMGWDGGEQDFPFSLEAQVLALVHPPVTYYPGWEEELAPGLASR